MVSRIQAQLERIHGEACSQRAADFLVTPEQAKALGATGRADEELLLSEDAGELSLALYLSPRLLAGLLPFEHAPCDDFLDGNLAGYCEVAEGVSHFLYVIHAAEEERKVSLLELEAQAEIDKFASCVLSRWTAGAAWARTLFHQLFERVSFRAGLSEGEVWRYGEANRLAKAYCHRLLKLVHARKMEPLLQELRYSFRLGAEAKLAYLTRA